jgi:hypothetical protein
MQVEEKLAILEAVPVMGKEGIGTRVGRTVLKGMHTSVAVVFHENVTTESGVGIGITLIPNRRARNVGSTRTRASANLVLTVNSDPGQMTMAMEQLLVRGQEIGVLLLEEHQARDQGGRPEIGRRHPVVM